MKKIYDSFLGSDEKTTIEFMYFLPKDKPKMIVQFLHGMAEYKERYEELGMFLANEGVAFYIGDHLGHGKSVQSEEHLGYFGGPNGWKYVLQDAKKITDIIKKEYPKVPLVIAGHSMGSFFARAYIAEYKNIPDKAVIIGTGNGNAVTSIGKSIAKIIAKTKGKMYRSHFLNDTAFGSYNKKIPGNITKFDWLSVNKENVKNYVDDPLCGYIFTANGFENLSALLGYVSKESTISKVRKDMPIFFMAGLEDPVGGYGRQVEEVAKKFEESGNKNITVKLYEEYRHEIFNEEGKEKVFKDFLTWILK